MSILTWPARFIPAGLSWHLEANTSVFVSPLTRATQSTELAGARHVADMTMGLMKEDAWREWSAFIARLRGQAGRVYVTPWHANGSSAPVFDAGLDITVDSTSKKADSTTPRADERYPTTLGTPLVNGAAQAGGSLITDGWSPGACIFKAGDYFHYDTTSGRTLHMVLDTVDADGYGRATLTIEPPIRTAPADNAALTIANPSCVMRIESDQAGALSFAPGVFGSTSIKLIETF